MCADLSSSRTLVHACRQTCVHSTRVSTDFDGIMEYNDFCPATMTTECVTCVVELYYTHTPPPHNTHKASCARASFLVESNEYSIIQNRKKPLEYCMCAHTHTQKTSPSSSSCVRRGAVTAKYWNEVWRRMRITFMQNTHCVSSSARVRARISRFLLCADVVIKTKIGTVSTRPISLARCRLPERPDILFFFVFFF